MFIETSAPRVPGNKAKLVSEVFPPKSTATCLTFYFHMYGSSIGSLGVYILTNQSTDTVSTEVLAWKLSGEAGTDWQLGQVTIASQYTAKPYQVIINYLMTKVIINYLVTKDSHYIYYVFILYFKFTMYDMCHIDLEIWLLSTHHLF